MVIGAFPIAKLAVLLVKQISKPIANAAKERAKHHPFFRTYVCMPPAQFYNWCEVKAKMWVLNLGKPVNIPVLSEQMAIELGANLLGEGIIFGLGAMLLIIEYNRQQNKEMAKEEKRQEEMDHLTSTIQELYFSFQQQETKLREMERVVLNLTSTTPITSQPSKPGPPPRSSPENTPKTVENKVVFVQVDPIRPGMETPYPDKGIIMRSLNYIHLDVLTPPRRMEPTIVRLEEDEPILQSPTLQEQPMLSVITTALHHIENDMRSLF